MSYTCAPILMRPDPSELDALYHASFEQVPEGNILEIMAHEIHHKRILRERYL